MKKSNFRPISETYKRVLLHIALKGAKTKYEIEKETRISHTSIFNAVRFLVKNGILKGEQIGFTRVGLLKTRYHLTLFGVFTALKYADFNDYSKIIEKWKHLSPFLFGKYDYLVQKVGKEEAGEFFYRRLRDIKEPASDKEIFEELIVETIIWYRDGFLYDNVREWHKFDKWIEIFKEDSDFRSVVTEFIDMESKSAKKYLEWLRFFKDKMSKSLDKRKNL